jgi:hypothetical protein
MYLKAWYLLAMISSLVAVPVNLPVQSASPAAVQNVSDQAVMAKLTALRDSFVKQVQDEGFKPGLAAPAIVLDNPPSFGRYEDDGNLLHIAVWSSLPPDQQARFARLASAMGKGRTGEEMFEDSVHHWVFIHELSHWWQACQHKTGENHYAVEYGANRIAAAYWRFKDPDLMQRTEKRMSTVWPALPNPLPEGQEEKKFFNENYDELGPTPGYIWFQYSMVLRVQGEKPLPSFKQALQQPAYQ